MKIEPLHNNVVIKPASQDEMTSSGLVLPQTNDEKPMQGEVVAVGPGQLKDDGARTPMSVQVGNTVLFTKYAPDEVEIDGEEYLVVGEDKIIGIVK
jgi:chaperonin GroES